MNTDEHWNFPFIVAIRSAPDVPHPASTKEEPIQSAYTLQLGAYIDEDTKPEIREYTLWRRGGRWTSPKLCLALRQYNYSPEGTPEIDDEFVEFSKDGLRSYGRSNPSETVNWTEIGADATPFLGPLYWPVLRSKRIRPLPDSQTGSILRCPRYATMQSQSHR